MIVLGVDPGYDRLGVAIVKKNSHKDELLFSSCVFTDKSDPIHTRIKKVGDSVIEIIEKWSPDTLAIEKLFLTKNQKTASAVSEVRGVINFVAANAGLNIYEYTPLEIKTTVAGYGKAKKEQVQLMVEKLIVLPQRKMVDDEVDAIACALTHIAKNPEKFNTQ